MKEERKKKKIMYVKCQIHFHPTRKKYMYAPSPPPSLPLLLLNALNHSFFPKNRYHCRQEDLRSYDVTHVHYATCINVSYKSSLCINVLYVFSCHTDKLMNTTSLRNSCQLNASRYLVFMSTRCSPLIFT